MSAFPALRRTDRRRRGTALFAALAAIAVLASFGVGLVHLQAGLARRHATFADRRTALYLAEAGIAEATLAVSQGRSGAVASADEPARFGRGVYWVESEDLPGGRKLLTAHAAARSGRFSLQTVVVPDANPVGSYGFFGDELVWIGWGSVLDGYDSREGSFASQLDPELPYETTGRGVEVFSNGDIVVEDPPVGESESVGGGATSVHGTLTPGADGYVRTSGDAYYGSLATVDVDALGMPAFVVPSDVVDLGAARTVAAGETLVYEAEDVRFDGVDVRPNGTLVLRGPVTVVADTLDVAPTGSVVFDDGPGPVRLYVSDRLAFEPGSLVSSPAPHETAFGTHVFAGSGTAVEAGSRVRFAPSGEFHGVVYAPDDDLVLPASLRFFGAAGAKRLFVEGGARASYDEAFANGGTSVPVLPKILSWQIVPLEQGVLRNVRLDPLAQLRLRGVDPVPSAVAARDTQVSIQYLDDAGALRTYEGDVGAFDWWTVGRVTAVRWTSATTGEPLARTLPAGYDPEDALMVHRDDARWDLYGTEYVDGRTVLDESGERRYRGVLETGDVAPPPVTVADVVAIVAATTSADSAETLTSVQLTDLGVENGWPIDRGGDVDGGDGDVDGDDGDVDGDGVDSGGDGAVGGDSGDGDDG